MVLGYKGFEPDMTCQDFQYEIGQTYEYDGDIGLCKAGFHFCRNMADVLNYYDWCDCRYAIVEALGEVIDGKDKSVTDKLRIVRELTKAEIFDAMYAQSGLELKDLPFPADEVIKAREDGTLDKLLPSGTEFPVRFSNGEWNVLVVCRDRDHTYLVTKYLMEEKFAMNKECTNEGGWPACGMRRHVNEIYDMLPETIRRTVIPMHIKQNAQDEVVECDDFAFLLSAVNVYGKGTWVPEADCNDTQIDIFRKHFLRKPANMVKKRIGASGASWWWLRSANYYNFFYRVGSDNSYDYFANYEGGVVVGFCIETRDSSSDRLVRTIHGFLRRLFREDTWRPERDCGEPGPCPDTDQGEMVLEGPAGF